jgi:hypothetical protein
MPAVSVGRGPHAESVRSSGRPVVRSLSGRVCENFLYYFKAAPRGRSRRRLGALAYAPADAPAPAGPAPVGWRGKEELPGRLWVTRISRVRAGLLPVRHCPRRPEPVKSAYGVLRIGYADS